MGVLKEDYDIMLADDDAEDVEIFGWALQKADIPHVIRRAENGDKLFILLKEKTPYILFLDIKMPGRDGGSCITEIRKNRDYDHLPVVMYSAFAYPQYIEDSYRGGANFFMKKSPSMEDMVSSLKKIFAIDWKKYQHYPMRDQFVVN